MSRRIALPSAAELQSLGERFAERICRALERQAVFSLDAQSSYLVGAATNAGVLTTTTSGHMDL